MGFKPDVVYTYKDGEFILRPHQDDDVRSILIIFSLLPIVIFGLLGNILIISVLKRSSRNSVNILLFNLAVWDIIFLIGQGVQYPTFHTCKYYQFELCQYYLHYYDPILTPCYSTIVAFGQSGSIYTTLIITIERFIVVLYPLHAKVLCTTKITRQMCLVVFGISTIFAVPYIFAFTISPLEPMEFIHNDTSYPKYTYDYTDFGNTDFFQAYIDYGQTLFQFIIPFLILSILNTMTALQVTRSSKIRNTMSIVQSIKTKQMTNQNQHVKSSKPESEATVSRMLIYVVILFGICYFPLLLESILTQSLKLISTQSVIETLVEIRLYIWTIGEITSTFNSSFNFVVYCLLGNTFRTSMYAMFSEWNRKLSVSRKIKNNSQSRSNASETENSRTNYL